MRTKRVAVVIRHNSSEDEQKNRQLQQLRVPFGCNMITNTCRTVLRRIAGKQPNLICLSAANPRFGLMRGFAGAKSHTTEEGEWDKHSSEANQYLDARRERFGKDERAYPSGWCNQASLAQITQQYSAACTEKGSYKTDVVIRTGGRVESVRKSGSGLFFFDLESEGHKLQVICSFNTMHNNGSGISKEDWDKIDSTIRRGDIIGIEGSPGLSKTGQFSLLGKTVTLLAPCLHMLPQERVGIKDVEVRFRQRYLDLIVNKTVRDKFIIRQIGRAHV